jgi:dUTP pyrophosphatase
MSDLIGGMRAALRVARLTENAQLPSRGSEGAAGLDLRSIVGVVIPGRGRALIRTGLAIELPPQTYGRIAPRSGLALKHGVDVGAGVIDRDYRGELQVLLFNLSDQDFEVLPGDRIAQLIVERIEEVEVVEGELGGSERGAAGLGSTGVK